MNMAASLLWLLKGDAGQRAIDENLETAAYPMSIILKGKKAMPALGLQLNDQQVADVVNYVRTHFGNNYRDAVTARDVKDARQ